jgi:demethylmenaquinone methyltransferase/2-methoxy-6-polyprenyl-1,4-benzoquinol methylase
VAAGDPEDHIVEQIAYYDARAGEYDEDMRSPGGALAEHGPVLDAQLHAFAPRGRVLEIACGTGACTEKLVPFADEIIALDGSREMLEVARRRVTSPKVRFLRADVFSWEPDGHYDVVFFAFWLSHIPPTHFQPFWELVARCVRPGGRVFFQDEGRHDIWEEDWVDEETGVVRRQLRDGSEHRAIKVLWDHRELQARLSELGWDFEVGSTGPFYWGHGARRA